MFPATRHSLLLAARQPELRAEAVAAIVEIYWKPAYKYLRLEWKRAGADAEDLTQDFFAALLDRDLLARWDPARGSFRAYLRVCLDSHAKNGLTAARRLKRGGGIEMVSLDFGEAEREMASADPAASPEEMFHREWQRRVFELAIGDLRAACERGGKAAHWQVFERYDLARERERPTYEELARESGIPATAVTNYLAWARRELRRLVMERLARTTGDGAELRGEARELFR